MSSISAGTTSTTGYVVTSDTTGALVLKTGASATTALTIDTNQNVSLAVGSANGVTYLNGSKVLTSGSALTFDGTTLGNTKNDVTGATELLNITRNNSGTFIKLVRNAGSGNAGGLIGADSVGTYYAGSTTANMMYVDAANTNLQFYVNSAEGMRLTSTGLGIGTSSPASKLDISGGGTTAKFNTLDTYDGGSSLSTWMKVGRRAGTGTNAYINTLHSGSDAVSALTFAFGTSGTGTEVVRIESGGKVGIGTSSPSYPLNVQGASDTYAGVTAGDSSIAGLLLGKDSNKSLGRVSYDNSGNSLQLWTNGSERARIDSSGNLLVGTTNTAQSSGVGSKILPNGSFYAVINSGNDPFSAYYSAVGYKFYINSAGVVNSTSTSISAISDIRFKENVRDLDAGLTEVMALKPRLYDWKEGKGANIKNARGFIAQEFEEVFPDLIDEWKDPAPEGEEPYKSVRQDLIPVLVKAMQEQQAIIQQLQADVAALKGTP